MPKILGSSLAEHRERTRTALFEALSELMSRRSFDKITLSDVANHAGVGRTAVYNHFADKEDLLLAFMEHEAGRYAEELSRALAGTQDPIDRLRIYVRQQALIARHFHFPTSGPCPGRLARTAGRLKAHGHSWPRCSPRSSPTPWTRGSSPPRSPSRSSPSSTPPSWVGARPPRIRSSARPIWRAWTPSCCGRWGRASPPTRFRASLSPTPPSPWRAPRPPVRFITARLADSVSHGLPRLQVGLADFRP